MVLLSLCFTFLLAQIGVQDVLNENREILEGFIHQWHTCVVEERIDLNVR